MTETELRKHRCCFSGHRPEKLKITEKELARLEGYRVRLSSGERSAPVREKSRAKPKQR